MKTRTIRQGGFFVVDLVLGTAMALALLMALSVTVVRQQQGERRLAAVRLAARELEAAMLTLQNGGEIPSGIQVQRLNDVAPPGMVWARLRSGSDSGTPTLTGLVPATAPVVRATGGGE